MEALLLRDACRRWGVEFRRTGLRRKDGSECVDIRFVSPFWQW